MADFENLDNLDKPQGNRRLPLLIAAIAVLGGVIVAIVLNRGPSLTDQEKSDFVMAQSMLRSDDYNEYQKGVDALNAILTAHPGFVEAITWLAQTYLAWADTLTNESNTISQALVPAESKLKSLVEAKKNMPAEKQAEADAEIAKAAKDFNDLKAAYDLKVGQMRKVRDDGFKFAKQALALKLADPQAQRVLADYYRIGKQWNDVQETLEFVAKAKPRSAGLRFIRGAVFLEKENQYDKAIEQFQEALQIDPEFNKSRYFMGLALDKKGDQGRAKGVMDEVLKQAPNHMGAKAYLKYIDLVEEAKKLALAAAGGDAAATPTDQAAPPEEKKDDAKNAKTAKDGKGKGKKGK